MLQRWIFAIRKSHAENLEDERGEGRRSPQEAKEREPGSGD